MASCSSCGKTIDDGYSLCTDCGNRGIAEAQRAGRDDDDDDDDDNK